MSTPLQLHLLRRTFAAAAVIGGLGFAAAAHAQGTVTLSGASSNSCSYSAMSITPNGNVTVTCSGQQPPPPPPQGETFAMSVASMAASVGGIVNWEVVRSGPSGTTFGATTVSFTYSGSGCALSGAFPVAFAANQMRSPISAPMAGDGICTATLSPPASPAVLGTPSSTVITVGTGGNPNQPPPLLAGCPTGYTAPTGMTSVTFGGPGNLIHQRQKSAQVVSIQLPTLPADWPTGQVTFSEDATTPGMPGAVLELSINTCAGLIESDYGNVCNVKSQLLHNNSITWLGRAFGGITETTPTNVLSANNLCWAGSAGKQYYLNARWTFPNCAYGEAGCGFNIQWNQGGVR